MSVRRHERTYARSCAIQVLYTSELQGELPSTLLEKGLCLCEEGALPEYALALVAGVEKHRAEIDEQLEATSENWKISRMPVPDRSILRLAAYEMIYEDEVPVSVAINEAVELAKGFGGEDDSPRFVNGVLGRIARQMEAEAAAAEEPAADALDEAAEAYADELAEAIATALAAEAPAEEAL